MAKRVIDCGNCAPDHAAIRRMLEKHFDVTVVQTHHSQDTLEELRRGGAALVLVNRKLDQDYSDGLAVIEQIKAQPELREVPVMMVTNYAEHQQRATEAGAVWGFGKLELDQPETLERLRPLLGE